MTLAIGRVARDLLSRQLSQRLMMNDRSADAEAEEGWSGAVPLHEYRRERSNLPVTFHRRELDLVLQVYSQMVAVGEWRDYAIDHLKDRAVFSVFRRTSEVPLFQIVKTPSLARRQGAYSVVAASGLTLKRGHDLQRVLTVFDKTLRLVRA